MLSRILQSLRYRMPWSTPRFRKIRHWQPNDVLFHVCDKMLDSDCDEITLTPANIESWLLKHPPSGYAPPRTDRAFKAIAKFAKRLDLNEGAHIWFSSTKGPLAACITASDNAVTIRRIGLASNEPIKRMMRDSA